MGAEKEASPATWQPLKIRAEYQCARISSCIQVTAPVSRLCRLLMSLSKSIAATSSPYAAPLPALRAGEAPTTLPTLSTHPLCAGR